MTTEDLVNETIKTPFYNINKFIDYYKNFVTLIILVVFVVSVTSYFFILKDWDSKISFLLCIICFQFAIVSLVILVLPIFRWILIPIILLCISLIIALLSFTQIIFMAIAKRIEKTVFFK